MEVVYMDNPYGGAGRMKLEKLLGPDELKDKCGLFARVTLHPGDVLGYHEHHGNGECYVVLSGEGAYNDNGVTRTLRAGDVTWTPDGAGHALSNAAGTTDLVFIALIVNS
jgi:mannose-6-phosphate isomerase-like protein (cupin superfamily)